MDVAQHREWVESTGGSIYLYHPFDPTLDYDELVNDLLWNVRREQGLEALLRVRCSSGIDVDTYIGAFLKRETGVVLPSAPVFGPAVMLMRALSIVEHSEMFKLQAQLLHCTSGRKIAFSFSFFFWARQTRSIALTWRSD